MREEPEINFEEVINLPSDFERYVDEFQVRTDTDFVEHRPIGIGSARSVVVGRHNVFELMITLNYEDNEENMVRSMTNFFTAMCNNGHILRYVRDDIVFLLRTQRFSTEINMMMARKHISVEGVCLKLMSREDERKLRAPKVTPKPALIGQRKRGIEL